MLEEKKCINNEELCEGKKELTQEELEKVTGGYADTPTKPRPEWAWTADCLWCPNCEEWVHTAIGPTIDGVTYNVCNSCSSLISGGGAG